GRGRVRRRRDRGPELRRGGLRGGAPPPRRPVRHRRRPDRLPGLAVGDAPPPGVRRLPRRAMIDPDRIFERVVGAMDRRVPRRRFLARFATAASALAVAPWRYISRPVRAIDVLTC